MRAVQGNGTKIVCKVVDKGFAASMGSYIFEACDVRLMGKQSQLLFHTVSTPQAEGNAWELARLAKEMQSLNDRLTAFIAGRLCIPVAEYKKRIEDRDYWLGSEEALAICAADRVL
jgi:ATP-dependent protease ClpP protease subunit